MNRYLPVAILFFFFNSFLLPAGLLYTTLLTPFFLLWLYQYPSFHYLWKFFLVSIPFAAIHLYLGVDLLVYIKSYILLFTVYVFGMAFYQFLRNVHSLGSIFRSLVLFNFILVLFSLIAYFIEPLQSMVWSNYELTSGIKTIHRLKMFTYEASYYCLLLAPLLIYYCLKGILFSWRRVALALFMLCLPFVFALSFGVALIVAMALLFVVLSDIRIVLYRKKLQHYLIAGLILFCLVIVAILIFFPDNLVFLRIENVFIGKDSSFRGRTFDSMYLGWKLAAQKSILFGAGAGQIKVNGLDLFNIYYNNSFSLDKITIPNNIGDILAQYGLLGVGIKLVAEVYFFVKTRVYSNYYRLCLFLFIFIYQFTGSFITNVVEYAIWLLAFCPTLFPEFNKTSIFPVSIRTDGEDLNQDYSIIHPEMKQA